MYFYKMTQASSGAAGAREEFQMARGVVQWILVMRVGLVVSSGAADMWSRLGGTVWLATDAVQTRAIWRRATGWSRG